MRVLQHCKAYLALEKPIFADICHWECSRCRINDAPLIIAMHA